MIKKTGQLSDLRSTDALTRFGLDLLQQERAAILSGSFDALTDLAERKTALLDEIENRAEAVGRDQTAPERKQLQQGLHGVVSILSRRAKENQNLLSSAMKGAQNARDMIRRLDEIGASSFYGASGHRIPPPMDTRPTVAKI